MLQVKMFGPGQAHYNGTALLNFPRQQACLMFCYLLISPDHPIHREQLAAVFWGDYPAPAARKHLRNALWRLKQTLESISFPFDDYVLVSDESLEFTSSHPYWLDIEVFESTICQFLDLEGEQLTSEQAARIEKALSLYTGDLLEGVYEDWCLYERERLSLLYLNTLSKLIAFYTKSGQYERGLSCGDRILSRDNTREKVHLQMMHLYFLMGDRQSALAQYRLCAQILKDELNIQPMRETTAIYQQMLHNQMNLNQPGAAKSAARSAASSLPVPITLTEQMLERLHKLQRIIEETQAEVYQLEVILNQASTNSKKEYGG